MEGREYHDNEEATEAEEFAGSVDGVGDRVGATTGAPIAASIPASPCRIAASAAGGGVRLARRLAYPRAIRICSISNACFSGETDSTCSSSAASGWLVRSPFSSAIICSCMVIDVMLYFLSKQSARSLPCWFPLLTQRFPQNLLQRLLCPVNSVPHHLARDLKLGSNFFV